MTFAKFRVMPHPDKNKVMTKLRVMHKKWYRHYICESRLKTFKTIPHTCFVNQQKINIVHTTLDHFARLNLVKLFKITYKSVQIKTILKTHLIQNIET